MGWFLTFTTYPMVLQVKPSLASQAKHLALARLSERITQKVEIIVGKCAEEPVPEVLHALN